VLLVFGKGVKFLQDSLTKPYLLIGIVIEDINAQKPLQFPTL
jgi:hypothetical protein